MTYNFKVGSATCPCGKPSRGMWRAHGVCGDPSCLHTYAQNTPSQGAQSFEEAMRQIYGEGHTYGARQLRCECGAKATRNPNLHSDWCPAHESGGKPAFKMPERLSF